MTRNSKPLRLALLAAALATTAAWAQPSTSGAAPGSTTTNTTSTTGVAGAPPTRSYPANGTTTLSPSTAGTPTPATGVTTIAPNRGDAANTHLPANCLDTATGAVRNSTDCAARSAPTTGAAAPLRSVPLTGGTTAATTADAPPAYSAKLPESKSLKAMSSDSTK